MYLLPLWSHTPRPTGDPLPLTIMHSGDILKWPCGTPVVTVQPCSNMDNSTLGWYSCYNRDTNRKWLVGLTQLLQHVHTHLHTYMELSIVDSSSPGQNGHHFADNIFRCIFMNEKFFILIKISLKFVPKAPIISITELVLIMAWLRLGDKPLSEPMLAWSTDPYMRH